MAICARSHDTELVEICANGYIFIEIKLKKERCLMNNSTVCIIKKVWNIVSIVIVVLAVLVAVLLVGTRVVGLRPFAVVSGSMEPDIMTGSLVYVKKVDPETLKVGDDITFTIAEGVTATHRIYRIIPKGMTLSPNGEIVPIEREDGEAAGVTEDKISFQTIGINSNRDENGNPKPDSQRRLADNVQGKVVFNIPLLGYVANYIQEPPGLYVSVSVGALLILLVFLPDLLFDDKKDTGSNNQKNKKSGKNTKKSADDEPIDETEADEAENENAASNDKFSETDEQSEHGEGDITAEAADDPAAEQKSEEEAED